MEAVFPLGSLLCPWVDEGVLFSLIPMCPVSGQLLNALRGCFGSAGEAILTLFQSFREGSCLVSFAVVESIGPAHHV